MPKKTTKPAPLENYTTKTLTKPMLRDRYEDIIDEVIKQYAKAESITIEIPKIIRRHEYRNYRIVTSENKNSKK